MTTDDDDRTALLATMYQQSDDDDAGQASATPQASIRSRRIRVGAVEYEVPSIEYVQQLEHMIARQARALEQHRRVIDRMLALAMKRRVASNFSHEQEL